jgi:hypothetical protein
MGRIVHARLDEKSDRRLKMLHRTTGLSESELLRRGLLALATTSSPAARLRIVGMGKFASGVGDLGSNKRHLEGFGRS